MLVFKEALTANCDSNEYRFDLTGSGSAHHVPRRSFVGSFVAGTPGVPPPAVPRRSN